MKRITERIIHERVVDDDDANDTEVITGTLYSDDGEQAATDIDNDDADIVDGEIDNQRPLRPTVLTGMHCPADRDGVKIANCEHHECAECWIAAIRKRHTEQYL